MVDEEAGTKEGEVEREVEKAADGCGERREVEKGKAVDTRCFVE